MVMMMRRMKVESLVGNCICAWTGKYNWAQK